MTAFKYQWGKKIDSKKTQELGRPFYVDAVFCHFAKQGGDIVLEVTENFKEAHFVNRQIGNKDREADCATMREAYEQFMKNGEVPESGMMISEWPAVSRAEAENLRIIGINTVEALAAVDDVRLKTDGINRALRDKALEWLAYASDNGAGVNKITALKSELEFVKGENAQLKADNAQLKADIAKLQSRILDGEGKDDKPKRKRDE